MGARDRLWGCGPQRIRRRWQAYAVLVTVAVKNLDSWPGPGERRYCKYCSNNGALCPSYYGVTRPILSLLICDQTMVALAAHGCEGTKLTQLSEESLSKENSKGSAS